MRLIHALPASLVLLLFLSAADNPRSVWGTARAQDGDSMTVDGFRVRLFGIDAPELDQTCRHGGQAWACGEAAAAELARLVTGKKVMCTAVGTDQYGRLLGRCVVGGTDINSTMVSRGYAVAYHKYSSDYVSAEAGARGGRLGLWASDFQPPSEYRADERQTRRSQAPRTTGRAATRPTGQCNIKGNRNRRGEWIYHLPGMPYYEQTRAEEIFCSEAQAQAAGYRRAIVK